ncbi:putative NADP-dependent oxidoreductase [Herbaspirillum sp. CF444]|uniref:NADP-dependent oxidoreductase n=1 Tax=Herbaspirillum sp. CF444 TaxID=1144319 RepID=UPI0002724009|nr:NADP-dependent oxidoreductase [Herbaspirillum sp. CF444]EJL90029.1 putative NADP-dependent oxidoreductase [Herbaspirillum sp. CF444]
MPQSTSINRRIVLASRPAAAPAPENFRLEEVAVPTPAAGQFLLRADYLSLDPYMRGRMSDAPSYAPCVEIGGVMTGGTVSRVVASQHPDYQEGDLVMAYTGWQDYALSDGVGATKLNKDMPRPSYALGLFGMPGFTAYAGLLDIGQPKEGETVVVAAATGAVGSVVGQIAKLKGCRVIGIAGGAEKCRYAVEELGFDACIDHRSDDLPQQLKDACPQGIDVYFENVGGKVFEAVLPLLNVHARVPLCGLIAQYSGVAPNAALLATLPRNLLTRRIRMQGFIIFDYYQRAGYFAEFFKDMNAWAAAGKIKYREDVVQGLENAPQAFMGMLEGKNFGKLVVQIA